MRLTPKLESPAETGGGEPRRPVRRAPRPDRMRTNLRRLLIGSIAVSVVFAAIFVFSDKGLGELRRIGRESKAIRSDIEILRAENARLRADIASFPTSKFRVERLAREELGLVKPGEVVLILPTERTKPPADRTDPPRTSAVLGRPTGGTPPAATNAR